MEGGHGPGILSAAVRAAAALLSACVIVMASGCSNADEESIRSETFAAGATAEIVATEYRFDPGRLVINGPGRAARLRIVMANRGTLAHNLHLRDGKRDLAVTPTFKPGEERSLSASLVPGRYTLVCTVADHEELGMTGKVEVR